MAFSRINYTGNGSTVNYTFSFPYLNKADIYVFVAGVSVPYTFLNTSTVTCTTAPASGAAVQVRRSTQKTTVPVDFTDGSVLLEKDLDLLASYTLYAAQEADDTVISALRVGTGTDFDATSLRINNLLAGVLSTDAVNKGQLDAPLAANVTTVTALKDAASASAGSASTSATNAATSATAAATSATNASTQAGTATTKASEAAASAASIAAGPVVSVAGLTGTVTGGTLKTAVSLDAVNNTTDANKPVSTANQTALDLKLDKKASSLQLGNSATDSQNFLLRTNLDGTGKLSRGAAGGIGDILVWDANGKLTLAAIPALASPQSMIKLGLANGYGSTNTFIRRFTNLLSSIGTDVTYADSATLGASFTVNVAGVYAIVYSDQFNVSTFMGLSLNTTQPTTSISTINAPEMISVTYTGIGNGPGCVSPTQYYPAGSVIRPHTQSAPTGGNPSNCQFTITRVA